jgi:hypothetical protein
MASDTDDIVAENAAIVHPVDAPEGVSRLWLGNRKVAESREALLKLRITHVLNCAPTQVGRAYDTSDAGAPVYASIAMSDIPGAMTSSDAMQHLQYALAFIKAAMEHSHRQEVQVQPASTSIVLPTLHLSPYCLHSTEL